MTDPELKVGDDAHDLVKRGKVRIVAKVADTVTEHKARNDYAIDEYKANALLDVDPHETVWRCVYLPDEPSTNFSGSYDFPESRLARIPVENARDDLRRTQEELISIAVEAMLTAADADERDTVQAVAGRVFDRDLVDEAAELAAMEAGDD